MTTPYFESAFEDYRDETAHIHPAALVEGPCRLEAHSTVQPFAHVMAFSIVGPHAVIGHNVTLSSGVMVGSQARVMNHSVLNAGVILEEHVYCGPCTVVAPLKTIRAEHQPVSRVSPTLIRQGATVGPNVTIAAGFTLGRYAFVEAGSVVDSHVPDFAVAYGNPLKLAGWRCACGERLPEPSPEQVSVCRHCDRRYQLKAPLKLTLLPPMDPTAPAERTA